VGYLSLCLLPGRLVGRAAPEMLGPAEALLDLVGRNSHLDGPAAVAVADVPGGGTVTRLVTVHSTQAALAAVDPDAGRTLHVGPSQAAAPDTFYVASGSPCDPDEVERLVDADTGEMLRSADGKDAAALGRLARERGGHLDASGLLGAGLPEAAWPRHGLDGQAVVGVYEDAVRDPDAPAARPAAMADALASALSTPWPEPAGAHTGALLAVGVVVAGTVVVYAGENRAVRWSRLVDCEGTAGRARAVALLAGG
jgi:hypothetical protein